MSFVTFLITASTDQVPAAMAGLSPQPPPAAADPRAAIGGAVALAVLGKRSAPVVPSPAPAGPAVPAGLPISPLPDFGPSTVIAHPFVTCTAHGGIIEIIGSYIIPGTFISVNTIHGGRAFMIEWLIDSTNDLPPLMRHSLLKANGKATHVPWSFSVQIAAPPGIIAYPEHTLPTDVYGEEGLILHTDVWVKTYASSPKIYSTHSFRKPVSSPTKKTHLAPIDDVSHGSPTQAPNTPHHNKH